MQSLSIRALSHQANLNHAIRMNQLKEVKALTSKAPKKAIQWASSIELALLMGSEPALRLLLAHATPKNLLESFDWKKNVWDLAELTKSYKGKQHLPLLEILLSEAPEESLDWNDLADCAFNGHISMMFILIKHASKKAFKWAEWAEKLALANYPVALNEILEHAPPNAKIDFSKCAQIVARNGHKESLKLIMAKAPKGTFTA